MPIPERVYAQDVGFMEAHKKNTINSEICRAQYKALVEAVSD